MYPQWDFPWCRGNKQHGHSSLRMRFRFTHCDRLQTEKLPIFTFQPSQSDALVTSERFGWSGSAPTADRTRRKPSWGPKCVFLRQKCPRFLREQRSSGGCRDNSLITWQHTRLTTLISSNQKTQETTAVQTGSKIKLCSAAPAPTTLRWI